MLEKAKAYRKDEEYDKMKELYLMILDLGYVDGLIELIEFYRVRGDLAECLYYMKMLDDIKKNNWCFLFIYSILSF